MGAGLLRGTHLGAESPQLRAGRERAGRAEGRRGVRATPPEPLGTAPGRRGRDRGARRQPGPGQPSAQPSSPPRLPTPGGGAHAASGLRRSRGPRRPIGARLGVDPGSQGGGGAVSCGEQLAAAELARRRDGGAAGVAGPGDGGGDGEAPPGGPASGPLTPHGARSPLSPQDWPWSARCSEFARRSGPAARAP